MFFTRISLDKKRQEALYTGNNLKPQYKHKYCFLRRGRGRKLLSGNQQQILVCREPQQVVNNVQKEHNVPKKILETPTQQTL